MKNIRFVGLDVHAETVTIAIAEANGEVRSLGTIPNREQSIRKLVRKLGPAEQLHACYEAGPTGYILYWLLTALGVRCSVVAPTLIPIKSGDRVKTDRRDAEKLARCLRAGELTPVWVPDATHEALRDLVRAREAAKRDQHRARQRLGKFLLRHGIRGPRYHEDRLVEAPPGVDQNESSLRSAPAGGYRHGLCSRGRTLGPTPHSTGSRY